MFARHMILYRYTIGGQPQYEEITQFQESRYVSSTEALYGIFQFDVIALALTVHRLDARLENHHTVNIRKDRPPS